MVVCCTEGSTYVVSKTMYMVVEIEAFAISLHDRYTLKSTRLWSNARRLQWKSCYRTIPVCGKGGEMMVFSLSSVVACPVVVLPCLETSVQVNLVFSWYTHTSVSCALNMDKVWRFPETEQQTFSKPILKGRLVLYLPHVRFLDFVRKGLQGFYLWSRQLFKLCTGCTCLPANICVSRSTKSYRDNS